MVYLFETELLKNKSVFSSLLYVYGFGKINCVSLGL